MDLAAVKWEQCADQSSCSSTRYHMCNPRNAKAVKRPQFLWKILQTGERRLMRQHTGRCWGKKGKWPQGTLPGQIPEVNEEKKRKRQVKCGKKFTLSQRIGSFVFPFPAFPALSRLFLRWQGEVVSKMFQTLTPPPQKKSQRKDCTDQLFASPFLWETEEIQFQTFRKFRKPKNVGVSNMHHKASLLLTEEGSGHSPEHWIWSLSEDIVAQWVLTGSRLRKA